MKSRYLMSPTKTFYYKMSLLKKSHSVQADALVRPVLVLNRTADGGVRLDILYYYSTFKQTLSSYIHCSNQPPGSGIEKIV